MIKVLNINDINNILWNDFINNLCHEPLFRSLGDLSALSQFGGVVKVLMMSSEDGYEVAFPIYEKNFGVLKMLDCFPMGMYSNLYVRYGVKDESISIFMNRLFDFLKQNFSVRLYIDPYDVLSNSLFVKYSVDSDFKISMLECSVLELKEGYESVYYRYKRGIKKNIRQCKERNVQVVRVDNELMLEAAYQLFADTYIKYTGVMPYPYSFYRDIFNAKGCADFYVATVADEIVAASVHLLSATQSLNLLTVSKNNSSEFHGNTLLIDYGIKSAAQIKERFYNLGASPLGGESLLSFKSTWGACSKNYVFLSYDSWIGKIARYLNMFSKSLFRLIFKIKI